MSIEIKGLSYIYGQGTPSQHKALDNINLTIRSGEFVGLIGHTGSGKSTLIQNLNALLTPSQGQVWIDEKDIFATKQAKKKARHQVGLVFQYPEHQLFEVTVYQDVAFGPKNMGLTESEVDRRVRAALAVVGIKEADYGVSPFKLSGGQKRRVAIAGVLAMEPQILILDEPTAGLDPRGRDEILREISKLHHQLKITVILVSHSMEDIANYVERIVVMDKGKIVLEGNKYQVFSEVEQLNQIGLGVPQVTQVCNQLKAKGFQFEQTITTIEEAVEAILPQLDFN